MGLLGNSRFWGCFWIYSTPCSHTHLTYVAFFPGKLLLLGFCLWMFYGIFMLMRMVVLASGCNGMDWSIVLCLHKPGR